MAAITPPKDLVASFIDFPNRLTAKMGSGNNSLDNIQQIIKDIATVVNSALSDNDGKYFAQLSKESFVKVCEAMGLVYTIIENWYHNIDHRNLWHNLVHAVTTTCSFWGDGSSATPPHPIFGWKFGAGGVTPVDYVMRYPAIISYVLSICFAGTKILMHITSTGGVDLVAVIGSRLSEGNDCETFVTNVLLADDFSWLPTECVYRGGEVRRTVRSSIATSDYEYFRKWHLDGQDMMATTKLICYLNANIKYIVVKQEQVHALHEYMAIIDALKELYRAITNPDHAIPDLLATTSIAVEMMKYKVSSSMQRDRADVKSEIRLPRTLEGVGTTDSVAWYGRLLRGPLDYSHGKRSMSAKDSRIHAFPIVVLDMAQKRLVSAKGLRPVATKAVEDLINNLRIAVSGRSTRPRSYTLELDGSMDTKTVTYSASDAFFDLLSTVALASINGDTSTGVYEQMGKLISLTGEQAQAAMLILRVITIWYVVRMLSRNNPSRMIQGLSLLERMLLLNDMAIPLELATTTAYSNIVNLRAILLSGIWPVVTRPSSTASQATYLGKAFSMLARAYKR